MGTQADGFAFARPDSDHLILEGAMGGEPIVVRLKKIDERSFPLVSRSFRWIKEYSD